MGASMVKQCFVADPYSASDASIRRSATPSRRSAHRHSHRPPPPPAARLLPPQPGQQVYAYDTSHQRSQLPRRSPHYEQQQQHHRESDGITRRSPVKSTRRERWDSRESTCSSSASMEEELDRRRRRPSHGSHAASTHGIGDGSFTSRSRHPSCSLMSVASTPASTSSSRRSRKSFSHQDLLPENYVLEDLLGSGTTSKCYRCRRTTDNRVFACKVINKRRLAFDAHQREDLGQQLRKEIQILRRLDHPHIAKLEDAFENDTYLILMMELLDGGELFETIIERGRLTEADAQHVSRCLLSAISYIHARGVVHRDLKPENLLLTARSAPGSPLQVKIIDFGFASSHATMTSILGTGGYLAPEILMQRPYTAAVDTWSFGVLLYLMLSGRLPFTTATQLQPGQRLSKLYQLTFPDKYWAGVSLEARDLLTKLLVLNPSYRLAPAEALKHPWFESSNEQL